MPPGLGSVLGPLYGIGVVLALPRWQDVFWINVPLTAVAMVMITSVCPPTTAANTPNGSTSSGRAPRDCPWPRRRRPLQPGPDGKQVLPSYGVPLVASAIVAAIAFAVWERFARTRLIEPAGVRFVLFLTSLGTSVCAGAALMVTLVNVELFGQGVLGKDQTDAAFLLLHFLVALPIGALIGRLGRHEGRRPGGGGRRHADRRRRLLAGVSWNVDVLSSQHHLGPFPCPFWAPIWRSRVSGSAW